VLEAFVAEASATPLTMPSGRRIEGSTLSAILTQAQISREDSLDAFNGL